MDESQMAEESHEVAAERAAVEKELKQFSQMSALSKKKDSRQRGKNKLTSSGGGKKIVRPKVCAVGKKNKKQNEPRFKQSYFWN